jgi:hypothetical protein
VWVQVLGLLLLLVLLLLVLVVLLLEMELCMPEQMRLRRLLLHIRLVGDVVGEPWHPGLFTGL